MAAPFQGRPRFCVEEPRCSTSIVAVPNRPHPNAGVRPTALATPFAARTTLAEAIVAMPPTRPALTRPMVAVNLNKTGAQAIRHLADSHRGGLRDRSCGRKKCRRSQSFERSYHLHPQS